MNLDLQTVMKWTELSF